MTRQQMVEIVLQAQRMNAILDAQATQLPHRGKAGSDRRTVKTTRLTLSGHRMPHQGAISVKISCAGTDHELQKGHANPARVAHKER